MGFENKKRIVIKIGTSTLTHSTGKPNLRKLETLSKVISDIKNRGTQVILVSSGAIAVGFSRLGMSERPRDTKGKQAAAAVGQCDLMSFYDRFLSEYGYVAAQILMDRDVIENETRCTNIENTLNTLLEFGAVPIINENDSISTEELEFGDNDNLSATVAVISEADGLIIITDRDGYFDKDPAKFEDAKKLDVVEKITEKMVEEVKQRSGGSALGTGGMTTKIEAAKRATENGCDTVIMAGDDLNNIFDLFDGKKTGTLFKAVR